MAWSTFAPSNVHLPSACSRYHLADLAALFLPVGEVGTRGAVGCATTGKVRAKKWSPRLFSRLLHLGTHVYRHLELELGPSRAPRYPEYNSRHLFIPTHFNLFFCHRRPRRDTATRLRGERRALWVWISRVLRLA